jgi:hypothetical protein
MGDVMGHEGIVMRDDKLFGPSPVKITGEFIVGNIGGGFGQVNEEEEEFEIVDHEESNLPTTEMGAQIIALVPGAFKPPHRGHLEMVERYAGMANKVRVLISNPLRNQRTLSDGTKITSEDTEKIWKNMVSHLGEQVEVEISPDASPITATYNFIGKDGPLNAGDTVLLGVCEKGDDASRYEKALKYLKDGVNGKVACVPAGKHSDGYLSLLYKLKEEGSPLYENMPSVKASGKDPEEIHASDMRYLLVEAKKSEEAVELAGDFVPPGQIGAVFSTFGITPMGQEVEEPLEEMSGMAGGAVGGYSGPLASTSDKPGKRDKRKKKKNENIDMSLVNEVFELLIERGIVL